jgi:NADPH-dependent curcumin reductase CurA
MVGGTVSRVEQSNHPDFKPGEWVLGYSGWQEYELSDGSGLVKLGENPSHPSWALGVLGMPGFTAYMGLLDIGQPKAGETLVVAAATGPVGATVGQIGKIKGCRVVGVAGGADAAMPLRFSVLIFVWITTRRLCGSWRSLSERD